MAGSGSEQGRWAPEPGPTRTIMAHWSLGSLPSLSLGCFGVIIGSPSPLNCNPSALQEGLAQMQLQALFWGLGRRSREYRC